MQGIFTFFYIFSIATAQKDLNSNLRDGQFFCPGMTEVVFTCEIRGSERITWTSDEYIGTRLRFVGRADGPGSRLNSPINENVYAVVTRNEGEGDSRVLVSELRIVPSQSFRNPSVQCIEDDRNTNMTIGFHVIFENPEVPQDLFAVQIEHASGRCIVTSSWLPPNNTNEAMVTNYTVYANGSTMETMDAAHSVADRVRISTLLNVQHCATHNITASASSPCTNTSQTSPFQLDPTLRQRTKFPASECDKSSESGSIKKQGSIVMITASVVMFLTATLFY